MTGKYCEEWIAGTDLEGAEKDVDPRCEIEPV